MDKRWVNYTQPLTMHRGYFTALLLEVCKENKGFPSSSEGLNRTVAQRGQRPMSPGSQGGQSPLSPSSQAQSSSFHALRLRVQCTSGGDLQHFLRPVRDFSCSYWSIANPQGPRLLLICRVCEHRGNILMRSLSGTILSVVTQPEVNLLLSISPFFIAPCYRKHFFFVKQNPLHCHCGHNNFICC